MKRLLEENETLTQIVNDAGQHSTCPVSPIYKPKLFFEKSG